MRPAQHFFGSFPAALTAVATALLLSTSLASAQSASPKSASAPAAEAAPANAGAAPGTLSVETKLVNLPVVVRDKKGALIQSLTRDDFSLQVDGHPQVIRYFDKDSNLPLTLGLLVDVSASQHSVIEDERQASSSFLDQMVTTEKDKAFVVQFAKKIELLQDVTNSRSKLQAAIKEIDTPPAPDAQDTSSVSTDDSNSTSHQRTRGGTALFDSLFLSADELMSKQQGRKAIIILSDGNDRGSKETLASSIEAAQRADTIVYAIYFKGDQPHTNLNRPMGRNGGGGYPGGGYPGGGYPGGGYPGGGYPGGGGGGYPRGGGGNNPPSGPSPADGKKTLARMATETGGRLFEVSKKETTAQIYTEIAEELRAQYRLGYTPDASASTDGYHKIDLAFAKPDDRKLTIQTREGYYTGK